MKPIYVNGVGLEGPHNPLSTCIRNTFIAATDNCSWIKEGDLVLLKPALNSPDPHLSTTHPLAIRVVADLLEERGANVPIVNHSGIEHVLHHPGGVIRGSSRAN